MRDEVRGDRVVGARVAAALLVLVGLVGAVAVAAFRPPEPVGADAPAGVFSAGRAMGHLREIARRPHPIGSADNARVRQVVADAARSFGAEVFVESGEVVANRRGVMRVATAHNVVARVRGVDPTISGGKALLLVAHHDSVPTGPGAADDGAAVAAMLETMRVLAESGGVRNDVVFLFTDGEEMGLLGAEMFVRKHGVDGYGAVLNWEARGSGGPVWMFETGEGNGPLVSAFAGASSRPIANSLAAEVYRRMPNGSDFTVFLEAGAPGLNSAFIERVHDYHSPQDHPDQLDQGSLQHHGETMVGMVRALGDQDLRATTGPDAVYFDVFSRVLVRYPVWMAMVLALVTGLGLVGLLVLGKRRDTLRAGGVLAVTGGALGVLVAAGAVSLLLWRVVTGVRPGLAFLPLSEPYDRGWFVAGFALLALAVLVAAVRLMRRRSRAELVGGVLLLAGLLLAITMIASPGAGFLLQWPLLAGLPALWWAIRHDRGATGLGLAALPALVAAVLYPPLVSSMLVALGMPLAAVAMMFALVAGVLLVPLLAALPRLGGLALGSAALAVLLVGGGLLASGFDRDEPRPNSLLYLRDTATGEAHWLSGDPATDTWTGLALGTEPERVDLAARYPMLDEPMLRAPAPAVDLPAPKVEVVEDTTAWDVRTVGMRITPAEGAWRTQVSLPRTGLRACLVGGERLDPATLSEQASPDALILELYGVEREAIVTCEVTIGTALTVDVADHWIGLPGDVSGLVGPRPPDTVLVPSGYRPYDAVIVRAVSTV